MDFPALAHPGDVWLCISLFRSRMGVAPLERTALKGLILRSICQFPLSIGWTGGQGARLRPSDSPCAMPPLHPMERGPGGEVPVPPARTVLLRYASAALFL